MEKQELNVIDIQRMDEILGDIDTQGIAKTKVSVVLRKKDGTELFKDLGANASLIGGVQEYVKNLWDIQSSDLIRINNLDSEFTGLEVPVYESDRRVVFGYGVCIDGSVGNSVNVVKRHSKGYTKDNLVAFQTVNTGLEDITTSFQKYAFRVVDNGDALYYIKKFTPDYKVITARNKNIVPDYPDTAYNGVEDVRSHVRIKTTIEKGECSRWFGKTQGTVEGAHFNSIVLFAGRPCTITIGGRQIQTYRDIIATNKINFKTLELNDTEITINYDIYFV